MNETKSLFRCYFLFRERLKKEAALALQRELEKAAREKEMRDLEEKRKVLEEKRKLVRNSTFETKMLLQVICHIFTSKIK